MAISTEGRPTSSSSHWQESSSLRTISPWIFVQPSSHLVQREHSCIPGRTDSVRTSQRSATPPTPEADRHAHPATSNSSRNESISRFLKARAGEPKPGTGKNPAYLEKFAQSDAIPHARNSPNLRSVKANELVSSHVHAIFNVGDDDDKERVLALWWMKATAIALPAISTIALPRSYLPLRQLIHDSESGPPWPSLRSSGTAASESELQEFDISGQSLEGISADRATGLPRRMGPQDGDRDIRGKIRESEGQAIHQVVFSIEVIRIRIRMRIVP
jgi:hypothetical protein